MKLLATSDAFNAEFRRLSQQYRFFDWAVAWASAGHEAFKGLSQYRTKIRRIVVGTHFHQTAPAFIDAFTDIPAVRYRLDQAGVNGVFHPKLYLFSNDETDWEAVIGSANFTTGAFTRNVEHAVVLSSKDAVEGCGYSDLIAEVARLWEGGRAFTSGELDAYRLRWDHNRKLLDRVAGHDAGQKRRKSVYDQDLMTYSWGEYLQALQERREKYFAERLVVLRATKAIWSRQPSYAKLSVDDRKKISGTASEKSIRWRLFGSMRGAFRFTTALRDENPHLLAAVDAIPLSGRIHREHYQAFITELARAFAQRKEFGGLAVATRLLCLRRPDYFVCVDKKNRAGLLGMLGISPADVTVATYWDSVVLPLMDTPWWQSERPTHGSDEQTIWDSRVAMVDALFYEGHG